MADLDIAQTSTSDLTAAVNNFSVNSMALDNEGENGEFYQYFEKAAEYFGYYKQIPELKKAIDMLAVWTVGKGWEAEDKRTQAILENLTGWGEDSFQSILQNMITVKKIVGDAFAEIIRNEDKDLINLKVISPERMRVVIGKNGMIKRYEQINKGQVTKKFQPHEILHLCNDRIGDETHGVSVVESVKWIIDARNEALRDERMIKHRDLALGVLYIDSDNVTKRNELITQYENAIKNGEVLVLPKDTAKLESTQITPQQRLEWIRYLENFFYQAVGVPRIIATSEGFTEAGGKVGFLTFEPIYTSEQSILEADLYNQMAIKVTFNRPPSLQGTVQEDEQKNSGQLGFQPKDTTAGVARE